MKLGPKKATITGSYGPEQVWSHAYQCWMLLSEAKKDENNLWIHKDPQVHENFLKLNKTKKNGV